MNYEFIGHKIFSNYITEAFAKFEENYTKFLLPERADTLKLWR